VKYRLEILDAALADIEAAGLWYENKQSGLGLDFTRVIRQALAALPSNPLIYRVRDRRRNIRWIYPGRFPHRIVYRVKADLIAVIAVVHAARHDREWKSRT
jgi:toxin ParE1/3/4